LEIWSADGESGRQLGLDDLVHGSFDEEHTVVAVLEESHLMEAAA
jgi:hypothetical protein